MADTGGTKSEWTALAHLLRPQGRRGEVLADLLTDSLESLRDGATVYLARPGFAGAQSEARSATITGHWLPVGRNHGRIVLTFAGIDSITLAESLEGLDVLIRTEDRAALEDGAEYIDDLLGCVVFNGQDALGEVIAVDFPTSPDGARGLQDAAPLLTVLTPAGEEILIPYVQAFLTGIDVAARRIAMQLPEGLVELNRGETGSEESPKR